MDLLKNLLKLLFLLIFPLGELVQFTVFKSVNVSFLDLGVILVLLIWFLNRGSLKNSLFLPFGIFIGVCLLSILLNIGKVPFLSAVSGFLYFVRWVAYVGIIFVVSNFNLKLKNNLTHCLIGAGILVMFYGYLQLLFFPSLASLFKLGWDIHMFRLTSSFLDPNFCSVILVLSFLLNFILLNRIKKKFHLTLFYLTQFILFLSILLTYSRTGLIALIASLFTLSLLYKQRKIAVGIVIIALLSTFLLPRSFNTEGTNLLRTISTGGRINSMQEGLMIFYDNPVIGVGFNNLRFVQYEYHFIGFANWEITHAGGGNDNSFIFVAETTGIVGFMAFLYLFFSIIKILILNIKKNELLVKISISSIVCIAVSSFFTNSLFYPSIMLWLWTLLGITLNN